MSVNLIPLSEPIEEDLLLRLRQHLAKAMRIPPLLLKVDLGPGVVDVIQLRCDGEIVFKRERDDGAETETGTAEEEPKA